MINDLRFVSKEVFDWVAVNPEVETRQPNNTVPYLRERGEKAEQVVAEWMMREEWDSNMGSLDPETLLILKETGNAEQDVLNEYDFGDAVEMAERDEDELSEPSYSDTDLPDHKDTVQTITGIRKRINALGWSKKLAKGTGKIERESMGRKRHNKPVWRKRI